MPFSDDMAARLATTTAMMAMIETLLITIPSSCELLYRADAAKSSSHDRHISQRSRRQHKAWGVSPRERAQINPLARVTGGRAKPAAVGCTGSVLAALATPR